MQKNKIEEAQLIEAVVQGMQAKKAQDIALLDLTHIDGAVAQYFVLCSGRAPNQVEAIAEAVIEASAQQAGQHPWHKEGWAAKEWILVDYVSVVVHVFQTEKRSFYALDTLWAEATVTALDDAYPHAMLTCTDA